MSLTKITTNVIADDAITADKISNTVSLGGPKIANVQYADATFTVINDTAANTSGTARLIINGDGFNSGVTVIVGSTPADSVTRISSTQLRANVTPQVAGSYPIYVQNTDGGTAIRVNGVTFSNTPIWGTAATLSNQAANTAFAVNLSANSDSAVTYSNTSALPAGTSLLANGLFYGTVTIGAETTYNFTVEANDAENQEVPRTFSLTVTVTPTYQLWSWGENVYGQLGQNITGPTTYRRSSPVQVGTSLWKSFASAGKSSFAIKSDNTLWSWGLNNYGQLGLGDTLARSSPVQIGSSTDWNYVFSSRGTDVTTTMAIKNNGTLWGWGENFYGQIGLNDSGIRRSSPVQVGTDTNWSKVALGYYGIIFLKTDGTLWSAGYGEGGMSGLNFSPGPGNYRSSPVQIGNNTWADVSVSRGCVLATKTNGTLWAWGSNGNGQLGLGDTVNKSSPTQVGSATNWSKISIGNFHGGGIKTDGTLWLWGFNSYGGLGLNATAASYNPVQVGNSTTWSSITCSYYNHTVSSKTDKTLWLWGRNNYGQLGLGNTINRSSPVQVGSGTNWGPISSNYDFVLAFKES